MVSNKRYQLGLKQTFSIGYCIGIRYFQNVSVSAHRYIFCNCIEKVSIHLKLPILFWYFFTHFWLKNILFFQNFDIIWIVFGKTLLTLAIITLLGLTGLKRPHFFRKIASNFWKIVSVSAHRYIFWFCICIGIDTFCRKVLVSAHRYFLKVSTKGLSPKCYCRQSIMVL